ncbi:hypothetical protein EC836_10495 [Erwinia sp. JUb26]|nr:hypothetical protein EC836_10495 [Erwinia sp. JUb26]
MGNIVSRRVDCQERKPCQGTVSVYSSVKNLLVTDGLLFRFQQIDHGKYAKDAG